MMMRQTVTPADLSAIADSGTGLLGKLLNSLSPEVKESLLSRASLRDVPAGTVIVEEDAPSDEVGYVIEGTLAMTQIVDEARTHIIGLLVPTDIYGRLFDGPSRYQVAALSPTRILSFPRAPFEQILIQNPEAERLFLVHLMDEVDSAREWLLLISGKKVINRTASFLNILTRRTHIADQPGTTQLRLPLTRKDLAHYLGTRPESLSRAFHELESMGILRIISPNLFEILDQDALGEISGHDLTVDDS